MFRAFLIDQVDDLVVGSVQELDDEVLGSQGILIDVEYSDLNYKDAMVIKGLGRLVRTYPHVPGVDLAGIVCSSDDQRFSVGDRVIVSGWRVGELYWGGLATKARVNPDFALKTPSSLSSFHAMALGTAGLSAMLAIRTLIDHGLSVEDTRPVLVTGAAGGVGSIAVIALHQLGFKVAASTGRLEESSYLFELGADVIIARSELQEPSQRPLESERFSAAIDNVGGDTLGRVLGQMVRNSSIASVGLAGGSSFTANVMPFVLRGVNILGIDSVTCPNSRRLEAWERLGELIPRSKLEALTTTRDLCEVQDLAGELLAGKIKGRTVIDVNS